MEGRLGANVRLLFVGLVLLAGSACAGRIHPGTPTPGDGRDDGGAASFVATAYCQGTRTATGTRPDERTIAADPGRNDERAQTGESLRLFFAPETTWEPWDGRSPSRRAGAAATDPGNNG